MSRLLPVPGFAGGHCPAVVPAPISLPRPFSRSVLSCWPGWQRDSASEEVLVQARGCGSWGLSMGRALGASSLTRSLLVALEQVMGLGKNCCFPPACLCCAAFGGF